MRLIQACLSEGYDDATRQAEILIHTLAEKNIRQVVVCRKDSPLHQRLHHLADLPILTAGHRFARHFQIPKGSLVHAHDVPAAEWAHWQQRLRGNRWLMSWRQPDPAALVQLPGFVTRQVKALLVSSSSVEQALRERGRCPVKRIAEALLPLSTNPMKMTALRSHYRGRFVIGHAGQLDDTGNQQLLVTAAEILHKELPGATFVLLGEGPQLERLKQRCEKLDNIDFVGNPEHPGDYFSIMNLFVEPAEQSASLHHLLQAMSFHIPVIASKVAGHTDLIQHRSNGLLFKRDDVKSLIEMIRVLYDSVPLRTRITRDAQSLVKESSPDQVALKHLAVYQALINSQKAPHEPA